MFRPVQDGISHSRGIEALVDGKLVPNLGAVAPDVPKAAYRCDRRSIPLLGRADAVDGGA